MELLINTFLKFRFLLLNLFRPVRNRQMTVSPEWHSLEYLERFDGTADWMMGRPGYPLQHYPEDGNVFGMKAGLDDEVCSRFTFRYRTLVLQFKGRCSGEILLAPLWVLSDPDLPEWDFEISNNRLSATVHYGWSYTNGCKRRSRCNRLPFINFGEPWTTWTVALEFTPYYTKWYVNGVLLKRTRIVSGGEKRIAISLYRNGEAFGDSVMYISNLLICKHKNDKT
jgi:hypothetical protein